MRGAALPAGSGRGAGRGGVRVGTASPRTALIGFPDWGRLFIAGEAERRFPFRSSPRGPAGSCPHLPRCGAASPPPRGRRGQPSPRVYSSPSLDEGGGSLSAFGITWEGARRGPPRLPAPSPLPVRECAQGRLPAAPQARAALNRGEQRHPPPPATCPRNRARTLGERSGAAGLGPARASRAARGQRAARRRLHHPRRG